MPYPMLKTSRETAATEAQPKGTKPIKHFFARALKIYRRDQVIFA